MTKVSAGRSWARAMPTVFRDIGMRQAAPAPSNEFQALTFPHVDAVFADAFCLTGCPEDAADLVIAAYIRAFQGYGEFRRGRYFARHRTRRVLDWLYVNLHAAFCDGVLACAARHETQIGE